MQIDKRISDSNSDFNFLSSSQKKDAENLFKELKNYKEKIIFLSDTKEIILDSNRKLLRSNYIDLLVDLINKRSSEDLPLYGEEF